MKKSNLNILFLITITMTACSFVSLDPGARDVNVANDTTNLKNCKLVGDTNVNVWSKAETFQSDKTVNNQLDTLARNQAATMGGNTVYPASDINNGQRKYNVYNCPTSPVQ